MRFFFDTEFNEHAAAFRVEPISIAIVPEDEARPDFYAVSREFDETKITPWLQEHVIAQLPPPEARLGNAEIRDGIVPYLKGFLPAGNPPDKLELWARNGATDQVVLAGFFGGLGNLRDAFKKAGLPRPVFRDMHELQRATGRHGLPQTAELHNCKADARHERVDFRYFAGLLPPERKFLIE